MALDTRELMQSLLAEWPEDPGLMDVEKEQLRALSAHDQPLFKLLKTTLDYCEQLKDAIATADLEDEDGLRLARLLQRKREGALNFVQWFVKQYDDPTTRKQRTTFNG